MKRQQAALTHLHSMRSGAVLIVAIIALILCTAVCMSVFRTTVLRQDRFELRQLQLQTQLLADSAIDRAAMQRGLDREYRHEVWELDINGEQARVEIELTEDTPQSGILKLSIRAQYPVESERRCQVSLESILTESRERSDSEINTEKQPI